MAIASTLLRFLAFTQTPFATGWDSYFYLVQIKSLEETGHMHSPEASLIYPYLRLFYWLSGDYVLALKIGTAVLCGIFTLLLCRRNQSLPLLGAWSLFSPQLTYFAAQYPKNLLGLVLFVAFVRSLNWAISKPCVWLVLPGFLLIVNYFGHRMMFGLAVVYLFLWLGFRFREYFSSTVFLQKALLAIGISVGMIVLAGAFFPGLAQLSDWSRLSGTFSWQPQFSPWSFAQTFGFERISGWWMLEISMVLVCPPLLLPAPACQALAIRKARQAGKLRRVKWIGGLILWKRQKGISNPALFWLCGLLLFPFLEWSLTGLAWRMFLVFVLLAPLAFDFQKVSKKASIVAFTAMIAASFFSWKSYSPSLHDPDYALFERVTRNVSAQLSDPDSFGIELSESSAYEQPDLFIAHNALAEYFTFTTGTDAMPWLPEYAIDSSKLWRIGAGVQGQTLRYFAGPENESKIKNVGGGYFLLPEFVWQYALKNARAEGDEYFLGTAESWLNPYRIRPTYLLKRKE